MNNNPDNYRPAQGQQNVPQNRTPNRQNVQPSARPGAQGVPNPQNTPNQQAYPARQQVNPGLRNDRNPQQAYRNAQPVPGRQNYPNPQAYPDRAPQRQNPDPRSAQPHQTGTGASYPRSATGAAYGPNRAYNPGSAGGRRQRDAMVNRPAVPSSAQRREPARRQKKPFRINWGVVVFFLLAAVVLGVSIWYVTREGWNQNRGALPNGPIGNVAAENNPLDNVPEAGETGEEPSQSGSGGTEESGNASGNGTDTGNAQEPAEQTPAVLAPDVPAPDENDINLTLYDTVTLGNGAVSEGDLILVNAAHEYSGGDGYAVGNQMKNAYTDRTGRLKVAATDINLKNEAFDALERLVKDLEEDTGSHDLLITSGHRTVAEQQEVWDYYMETRGEEYTVAYVAKPGCSEHNTGLACDLSFYTDDGASVPVSDYEHGWWLAANCAREGFIRRYPDDKSDITGISYEPWHFRYIGIPHAYICVSRNWCLEEYVEGVKAYSAEGTLLYVKEEGSVTEVSASDGLPTSGGWLVYYVPKAAAGGQTEIKVPRGSDYEISGNNADGFIVTVDLR